MRSCKKKARRELGTPSILVFSWDIPVPGNVADRLRDGQHKYEKTLVATSDDLKTRAGQTAGEGQPCGRKRGSREDQTS